MKFGSLVAGITAATMVLAPVAAQAGTSASASVVKPVYGSRTTTSVDKKQSWASGLTATSSNWLSAPWRETSLRERELTCLEGALRMRRRDV